MEDDTVQVNCQNRVKDGCTLTNAGAVALSMAEQDFVSSNQCVWTSPQWGWERIPASVGTISLLSIRHMGPPNIFCCKVGLISILGSHTSHAQMLLQLCAPGGPRGPCNVYTT